MEEKSFYSLDYIIQINEERHEQYTSAYQKILDRFTNILIIYSAIAIFIIPLIQDFFVPHIKDWVLCIFFLAFSILFVISIIFTIRLIIPVEIAYLEIPKKYYNDIRLQYEQTYSNTDQVKELLKASYITELETAVTNNEAVFRKKSSLYYNALMFALLSTVPYLICLGFHISKKEENVQKIEIVNTRK